MKKMERLKAFIEAAKALEEDGYSVTFSFNEGSAFLEGKPISSRRISVDIRKKHPASGEAQEIMALIQS
jgi:hypothetical protein